MAGNMIIMMMLTFMMMLASIKPYADAFVSRRFSNALSSAPMSMSLYRDFFSVEDRLFDSIFDIRSPVIRVVPEDPWASCQAQLSSSFPFNIDYRENIDGTLEIKADLPGLKKKEVNIEVKDNILTLSVKKTTAVDPTDNTKSETQVESKFQSEAVELQSKVDINEVSNMKSAFSDTNAAIPVDDSIIAEKTQKYPRIIWKERTSFEGLRNIQLPEDIDESNISAVLEDGVLTVMIPRVAQKKPPKRTIIIQ